MTTAADQDVYDEAFLLMLAADHLRTLMARDDTDRLDWELTASERLALVDKFADLLSRERTLRGAFRALEGWVGET